MQLLEQTIVVDSITDPITIIPFGCIHEDDPGFKQDLFEQCLDEIMQPNTYAIGCGDYKNFLRSTARKYIQGYTGDEDSFRELDSMVREQVRQSYKKFYKRIEDRVLLMGEGNHYHEFQNRTTDTQYLCDLMKVPYGGKPCLLRLIVKMRYKQSVKVLRTLRVLIHHGDWSGGYTRVGGDVNSAEMKALGFDFDIYLFSHTHRKWGMHIPTLTIPEKGELKTVEKPRVFVRTGCFVTGYDKCEHRSYAHKKLLHPTELGFVKLQIKFYRQYDGEKYQRNRSKGRNAREAKTSSQSLYKYKFSVQY